MSRRDEVLSPFLAKRDYMEARVKEGIESHRKGTCALRVTDASGAPIPGARIALTQKRHEFLHGANCFMLHQLPTPELNRLYEERFCEAFNLATVPFYWNGLEPEQGKPRYAADSPFVYRRPAPDLCVAWCEEHGITPKCHCLNYERWSPVWMPTDVKTVRRLLAGRMRQIAERYASRIPGFEVTNEYFLNETDEEDRKSTMNFRTPDVVEWSFETARRYFPENELIINESTRVVWGEYKYNRSPYYMQIERALRKGAPIDAIGFQYHMFFRAEDEAERVRTFYDPERLYAVMDQYADFGLPFQITEVTIPAYQCTPEDEALQAEILTNLYSIWFSHKNMEAIIYWNLPDGYAHANRHKDENYYGGGLLRRDMSEKPAYRALVDLFTKTWHTEAQTVTGEDGTASFRGFFGDYGVTVSLPAGGTVSRKLCFRREGSRTIHVTI